MYKVWIFAIFEKRVFVRFYATFASKNTPKKDRVYSIYPVQIRKFSTNFAFLPQNWFLRKKGKNKYEKKKNLQNFGIFKPGCLYVLFVNPCRLRAGGDVAWKTHPRPKFWPWPKPRNRPSCLHDPKRPTNQKIRQQIFQHNQHNHKQRPNLYTRPIRFLLFYNG